MDLWTALFTVFRRWYVSLPIAILAFVGMIVIGGHIAQEYEARASVVLVPPAGRSQNGIQQRPDNPLDAKTAATATAKQVDTASTQRRFDDEGLSSKYKVNLDRDTAIIEFVVTGSSADQALETAQRLIDEAKGNLARIQQIAGAADDAMISLNTVDLSDEAEPIKGDRLRVQATVLLLGLVAAISAAFIVESFQARRAAARRGGVAGTSGDGLLGTPGTAIPMLTSYPAAGGPVVAQGYPALTAIPPGYMPLVPMVATNGAVQTEPAAASAEAPAQGEHELFGSVDELFDDQPIPEPAAPPTPPDRRSGGNGRKSPATRFVNSGKRGRPSSEPEQAVIDLTATTAHAGQPTSAGPAMEAAASDPTGPDMAATAGTAVADIEIITKPDNRSADAEPGVVSRATRSTGAAGEAPEADGPTSRSNEGTDERAGGANTADNAAVATDAAVVDAPEAAPGGDAGEEPDARQPGEVQASGGSAATDEPAVEYPMAEADEVAAETEAVGDEPAANPAPSADAHGDVDADAAVVADAAGDADVDGAEPTISGPSASPSTTEAEAADGPADDVPRTERNGRAERAARERAERVTSPSGSTVPNGSKSAAKSPRSPRTNADQGRGEGAAVGAPGASPTTKRPRPARAAGKERRTSLFSPSTEQTVADKDS